MRNLRVLVIHAYDAHTEELVRHIRRIGCNTEAVWPVPEKLPDNVDILFLGLDEKPNPVLTKAIKAYPRARPSIIGVVAYENPSVLQQLIELNADAVIAQPARPYGVLSSMVLARRIRLDAQANELALLKLQEKVHQEQTLNRAKLILMKLHQIGEEEAYSIMREQAMVKRVRIVEIAEAIINADGILGNMAPKKKLS
ncbi:ANTAR domain-containing protein [Ectothiorhodosinus mongolicus]|nr:ANTAR domain-containing protein [Ectothiorhodosinus mongolicus]